MKLEITQIQTDEKISPRIEIGVSRETVESYTQCFDQLPPIVVFKVPDQTNYILVDGWHRFRAAQKLGLKEVEADTKFGNYNDAKEYALLSNLRHGLPLTRKEKQHVVKEFLKLHPERANNWIGQDLGVDKNTVEKIRGELETMCEIHTLDYFITRDGGKYPRTIEQPKRETAEPESQTDEVEQSITDPDPEPETPQVPTLGIYQLNQVHQVDCIQGLSNLPEASLDLIFADPPYNIGVKYSETMSDKLPSDEYFNWCAQWFMAAHRAIKPGGSLYVMHYPEVAARWKQQLDLMFSFRHWITWVYNSNIGHSNGDWSRSHRTILYYVKGSSPNFFDGTADPQPYKNPDDLRIKHLGKEGTTPYDWWEFNLVKNVSADKTNWANQIPVDLVRRIILSSCPQDGIVCDPFMGSGTTAVSAHKTERKWIGFDIKRESQAVTHERLVVDDSR